jgi:hypothetical protein
VRLFAGLKAGASTRRKCRGPEGSLPPAANAWDEFWPQAKGYIFHRGKQP